MKFTLKHFQKVLSVREVWLLLPAPDNQDMNDQVEVTWQTFWSIAHSIMVHPQVYDEYIHFELMYTTDDIFPFLPIKNLVNRDDEPTTPRKLTTGNKSSVSNWRIYYVYELYEGQLHTLTQKP